MVKNPRNGWDIKKPHAWWPCGHAQTRAEAVMLAREICRKEGAECIIHGEDGKFRSTTALEGAWIHPGIKRPVLLED